jgi:hypothetical protein
MTKKISLLIGILIGITTLVGVGHKLDCRWAKPSMTDHEELVGDVEGMRKRNAVEAIWQIEDRYRGVPQHNWSPLDLDRYRRLQEYLRCLEQGRKDCQYYG